MSWGKRARLIANQALWALWHRFPFIRSLCLDGNWFILMESRGPLKCFYPSPLLSALIDWIWMWSNWTPQWCWQSTKCFETYVSALYPKSWNHLGNQYNSTPSRKEIWYKILWVFGGSRPTPGQVTLDCEASILPMPRASMICRWRTSPRCMQSHTQRLTCTSNIEKEVSQN